MPPVSTKYTLSKIMHPADASDISKMNAIPGFKAVSQKIIGEFSEHYADVEFSAEGVSVNSTSMPRVDRLLKEALRRLGINEVPKMSTDWAYHINTFSVGENNFRIILLSGAVDLLNDNELLFLIGHELGHWISGHKTYHMLTEALMYPLQNSATAKILLSTIKFTLLDWYRTSDYTADRFGLLCCGDIKVALSTLIKKAGLPQKEYGHINYQAFIRQANDFEKEHDSFMDNAVKFLTINSARMPWTVKRASELMAWYSDEGNKLINNTRR